MGKKRRAIVVVTEGASWELLEAWSAKGLLPGFRRLFGEGSGGRLVSGPVPYEVPGLVSIATGRRAGEHGMFSFWDSHRGEGAPRLLDPSDTLAAPLWRRPDCASLRFGLINLYGTHPPSPINGSILSYAMGQTVRSSYPKELMFQLSEHGIRYAQDVSIWYAGQARAAFTRQVFEADNQRAAACLHLFERGADVIMMVLTCLDRVGHFYWQELEPGSPFAPQETAVFGAFATCDRIIGRLLELVDDQTSVLAVSEHGFGPLRSYVSVNRLLAQAGFLAYENEADERAIDWRRTRAYESVQGTHGVSLNVPGLEREEGGGAARASEHHALREEVRSALRGFINPHTGLPLFARVSPREEVYSGAGAARAPDVIVEPLDERYLPLGDPHWAVHVNRRWQSGWHRRNSYFAGVGPTFRRGQRIDGVEAVDVAPTLFHAMGMAPADDFCGRVWGS